MIMERSAFGLREPHCKINTEIKMRICRFNGDRIGLVRDPIVFDITELCEQAGLAPPLRPVGDPLVIRLPGILKSIAAVETNGLEQFKIAEVRLECPVRFPTKLVGAGSNYARHREEMTVGKPTSHKGYDLYSDGVFLKANSSLAGPVDGISIQFPNRDTHHEVELVAVIGEPAKNVSSQDALKYVAAYTVGLDITMRGKEERSLRKSFDTYSVLGPWLITADELGDPGNVELTLSVNGVRRQKDSTKNMVVDTATIIAFASRFYTLLPGDLIWTGTPSGVGAIRHGDHIKAGADCIGLMDVDVRLASDQIY